MDPKEIVRLGYNQISYNYRDDDGGGWDSNYVAWLAELSPLLSPGARVLDLGCGCGVPAGKKLAEKYEYTGVDLSEVQIRRARKLVPKGDFIRADFSNIDFPKDHFSAVVSLYAIIHLPIEEQPRLFESIFGWLQTGGYFVVTVGQKAWTGTEDDWHGAHMYWSHGSEETYVKWLRDLGFRLEWTRFIPEGDGGHTLLLAQKAP